MSTSIVKTAGTKVFVTVDTQGAVFMHLGKKKILLRNLASEDIEAIRSMAANGDGHEEVDTAALSDIQFIQGHRLNTLTEQTLQRCRPEDLSKHRKVLALADRWGFDSYTEAVDIASELYRFGR